MTYWIYNPETLKDVEMEGRPTDDDRKRCDCEGMIIFNQYLEVVMRRKDDEKAKFVMPVQFYDKKKMTWDDEISELDISELVIQSSVNHEIVCFETVEPNLVNQKELVNQISKSKRGGKREGAGAKKGISKSIEHRVKISKSMQGKRNAVKSKGEVV